MLVSLAALWWSFIKIGAFTYGGGYAMIPLIQREIIEVNGWLTMPQFLDIVAIAEMTPGPIAINTATFVGYRVAGVLGSLAATFGVVLPSFIIIIVIAALFSKFQFLPVVQAGSKGIRAAVVALIALAVWALGMEVIQVPMDIVMTLAAFCGAYFLRFHPLALLGAAGLAGFLFYR